MQESGLRKIFTWKCLTFWRPVLSVFLRAHSASFLISTLNSFQGVLKVSSLQWSWFNLCRGRQQVPICSWRRHCRVMNLTMVWDAFYDRFVPPCWQCSLPGLAKTLLIGYSGAATGVGLRSSKSLWMMPVLPASGARKIVPFVAYLQLHFAIINLIWNYRSFYQRLSHTFGNVRSNFLKQATQKCSLQLLVRS